MASESSWNSTQWKTVSKGLPEKKEKISARWVESTTTFFHNLVPQKQFRNCHFAKLDSVHMRYRKRRLSQNNGDNS